MMGNFSTINTWFSYRKAGSEEESFEKLQEGVNRAPIEAIGYIAETKITMRQLLNLKPGDTLMTKKNSNSPLLLELNGKPKFLGTPGEYKGRKAFRILKKSKIDEQI
jgi:flagellar motor switch protein FliM